MYDLNFYSQAFDSNMDSSWTWILLTSFFNVTTYFQKAALNPPFHTLTILTLTLQLRQEMKARTEYSLQHGTLDISLWTTETLSFCFNTGKGRYITVHWLPHSYNVLLPILIYETRVLADNIQLIVQNSTAQAESLLNVWRGGTELTSWDEEVSHLIVATQARSCR